jgi:hypothetical protein
MRGQQEATIHMIRQVNVLDHQPSVHWAAQKIVLANPQRHCDMVETAGGTSSLCETVHKLWVRPIRSLSGRLRSPDPAAEPATSFHPRPMVSVARTQALLAGSYRIETAILVLDACRPSALLSLSEGLFHSCLLFFLSLRFPYFNSQKKSNNN